MRRPLQLSARKPTPASEIERTRVGISTPRRRLLKTHLFEMFRPENPVLRRRQLETWMPTPCSYFRIEPGQRATRKLVCLRSEFGYVRCDARTLSEVIRRRTLTSLSTFLRRITPDKVLTSHMIYAAGEFSFRVARHPAPNPEVSAIVYGIDDSSHSAQGRAMSPCWFVVVAIRASSPF